MRLQRVAVMIAAAVGVGFLVVGCGPPPGSGSGAPTGKAGDSSKLTPVNQAAGGGDKGKELADKVKAATDDINKDVEPLKKALEAMKEKVTTAKKDAGTDANKLEAASKLEVTKDEAEALMKQIDEKLGGLKSVKDVAALDSAVKAIKELIEKAKPKLKDYMPK